MFLLTTSVIVDFILKHDSSAFSKASVSAASVLQTTFIAFLRFKDFDEFFIRT